MCCPVGFNTSTTRFSVYVNDLQCASGLLDPITSDVLKPEVVKGEGEGWGGEGGGKISCLPTVEVTSCDLG